MGPDLTTDRRASACPSCGASVRPDAAFCGQCYADFRPAPAPVVPAPAPVVPAQGAAYGVPALDPLTAPLLDVVLPAAPVAPAGAAPAAAEPVASASPASSASSEKSAVWPCSRCDSPNPLTAMECTLCGSPFLSAVSSPTVSLKLPLVGDLSKYGRGQRALIALAALVAVLAPFALITLLLTKSPPPDSKSHDPGTSTSTVNSNPNAPGASTYTDPGNTAAN